MICKGLAPSQVGNNRISEPSTVTSTNVVPGVLGKPPRRSPPPSFASPGPSPLMTPETTPRGDVSPVTWWLVGRVLILLRDLCFFF